MDVGAAYQSKDKHTSIHPLLCELSSFSTCASPGTLLLRQPINWSLVLVPKPANTERPTALGVCNSSRYTTGGCYIHIVVIPVPEA
jgi:hypothetical protein